MTSVPPKLKHSGNHAGNRLLLGVLAVTLAGLAALVFFLDPATHKFYPACQFHRFTGLNCPGCGMTRALHALLHGDFATALRDNALLVFGLSLLAVRGAWFGVKKLRGQPLGEFLPMKILWVLLAVMLVFTGLRNFPAFAFLSP